VTAEVFEAVGGEVREIVYGGCTSAKGGVRDPGLAGLLEGGFENFDVVVCVVEDKGFAFGELLKLAEDLGEGLGLGLVLGVFLGVGVVNGLTVAVDEGDFFEVGFAFSVDDEVGHIKGQGITQGC
jgi:hypothetical protein